MDELITALEQLVSKYEDRMEQDLTLDEVISTGHCIVVARQALQIGEDFVADKT